MASSLLSLPHSFAPAAEAPATSNVAGGEGPFQRWYRFKEAFSPTFVEGVLRSMPNGVRTCLDPFGGSGTTALTCQFLGIHPTTIEVQPFLADLIEAKLTRYDVPRLRADWLAVLDRCHEQPAWAEPDVLPFLGAPPTFVQPGVQGRWIFNADVASRIQTYRDAIADLADERNRRLLTVILGSLLVTVSNVTISGKGRRYRSGWQQRQVSPRDVDRLFETAYQAALYDICRYGRRACEAYSLLRGDCRTLISTAEPADLVLFSPPYANSFDYTDIYNVELWALGYLKEGPDNRALREATLRSHVQIKRKFAQDSLGSAALANALERLEGVREELWSPHIPAMVAAYFEDLTEVLRQARAVLSPSGQIVMVVGNSSYAGVLIDVAGILRELAPTLGLRCDQVHAVRSMRNSPQHGGVFTLTESLIRLAPA